MFLDINLAEDMEPDKIIPNTGSGLASAHADAGPLQAVLETIVRGVEAFHIPAGTDWRDAKRYLADDDGQWKFSAVLVAIVERREPTILLTKRSSGLSEYSSHVSFPGGRPAESDGNIGATALREAFEEIRLAPGVIRVVGCLPIHKTRKRNHAIFPVVGIVPDTAEWEAAPAEVEEIFEFPFSTLLNPALPRQYSEGERAGSWYWADQAQDVWGVTAVILKSLAALALDAARDARGRRD
ncbi:coenzyme A pyrophosphatase [Burkholderia stabilis]|uniref:NUDIX hydrolase n=1 Tax=Burkholderia stabilis TaxID=95485 RepID=UPI000851C582|nr:CoA pyrophosphatase [Burkholderia stabilis]AOR72938.1 coenzyme A pyrophosphatase [Burkholderia stabilis]HDR9490158.1 CoA pyrophosphatase [Burkholderia stabilis]HDR9521712.1 CoA pyrophosphatase [Burkholderia stabilis]HDR9537263.1 CoA pyrophosphatase [Burkholderia stabilis]HDR9575209.1 CoA pyrophosphatase [Burkholderia stabilis]